jgi:hypothetical protein
MTVSVEQAGWVARVLGVRPPSKAGSAAPRDTVNRRALWRDAKEQVDAGLERLASELRCYDDPDLERIADYGLFGLGKGENVALNKALIEYDAASPERRSAASGQLRSAIAGYRTMIQSNPMVGLIDRNPVVPMSMGATLRGALDQIEQSLAA